MFRCERLGRIWSKPNTEIRMTRQIRFIYDRRSVQRFSSARLRRSLNKLNRRDAEAQSRVEKSRKASTTDWTGMSIDKKLTLPPFGGRGSEGVADGSQIC